MRRPLAPVVVVASTAGLAAQQAAAGHPHRAGGLLAASLGAAIASVLLFVPRTRWLAPAVVPALVGAGFGVLRGGGLLAVVPLGASVALAVALAAGVDVARHEQRAVRWIARVLARALGTIGFVVLVLPAWVWNRATGRGEVAGRARGRGWGPAQTASDPAGLAALDPARAGGRTITGRVAWAVGAIALLLAADYGVGWGWDQLASDEPTAAAPSTAPTTDGTAIPRDPRADSPAMAGAPWRERYFQDFRRSLTSYWPYTEARPVDFASPYINTEGWVRRSYQTPGDAAGRPVVWLFGGSTAWGEGQRDEQTIASELVRLAEAAGTPITMRNLGQRGFTHFQEMILFEQRLAIDGPPDLAVFYDGLNEVVPQAVVDEPVPTHYLASVYAEKLAGQRLETMLVASETSPAELLGDVRDEYLARSAIARAARWVAGEPAAASAAQDGSSEDLTPGINTDQRTDDEGNIVEYDLTEQDGIDAADVYARGRAITMFLAERNGVRPVFFWQPGRDVADAQLAARTRLTPPTIDIADALDEHQDTYIDAGHTNEEGAAIVAEAIWEHLGPVVLEWYEDQP